MDWNIKNAVYRSGQTAIFALPTCVRDRNGNPFLDYCLGRETNAIIQKRLQWIARRRIFLAAARPNNKRVVD
jgi:hypothetical protein